MLGWFQKKIEKQKKEYGSGDTATYPSAFVISPLPISYSFYMRMSIQTNQTKKRMGRPSLPEEEKRTGYIGFTCKQVEREFLLLQAKKEELSLSEYCLSKLLPVGFKDQKIVQRNNT